MLPFPPLHCRIRFVIALSLLTMSDALSSTKPMDEGSVLLNPWLERWSTNKIGFHQQDVNDVLLKHGATIIPNFESDSCSSPVRVFVPLCGKTVDMAFLAGHGSVSKVIGVEGIRKAFEDFAAEHPSLEVKPKTTDDAYERFEGNKIELLKGDFFGLDPIAVGGTFDGVWDRASMVAIDPPLREAYVQVMRNLLKPGGTILLVTLERRTGTPEGMSTGPPFSIPENEVRRLYESQDWVESVTLLDEVDEFVRDPGSSERYRSSGVTSFFQLVFEIKAKS